MTVMFKENNFYTQGSKRFILSDQKIYCIKKIFERRAYVREWRSIRLRDLREHGKIWTLCQTSWVWGENITKVLKFIHLELQNQSAWPIPMFCFQNVLPRWQPPLGPRRQDLQAEQRTLSWTILLTSTRTRHSNPRANLSAEWIPSTITDPCTTGKRLLIPFNGNATVYGYN